MKRLLTILFSILAINAFAGPAWKNTSDITNTPGTLVIFPRVTGPADISVLDNNFSNIVARLDAIYDSVGIHALATNLNLYTNFINNVKTPTNSLQAANKGYVDAFSTNHVQWAASTGLVNVGTSFAPTGSISSATAASLALANTALQPANTSGWVVSSHSGFLAAGSNVSVLANDSGYASTNVYNNFLVRPQANGTNVLLQGEAAAQTDQVYCAQSGTSQVSAAFSTWLASSALQAGGGSTAVTVTATAYGDDSSAGAAKATAIGNNSSASKTSSTAIGDNATADGLYSTAIGYNANSGTGAYSIELGIGTATNAGWLHFCGNAIVNGNGHIPNSIITGLGTAATNVNEAFASASAAAALSGTQAIHTVQINSNMATLATCVTANQSVVTFKNVAITNATAYIPTNFVSQLYVSSVGMGAVTVTNNSALVAGDGQVSHGNGSVSAGGGFWDNAIRVPTNIIAGTNVSVTGQGTANLTVNSTASSSGNGWTNTVGTITFTNLGLNIQSGSNTIARSQYGTNYIDAPIPAAVVTNYGLGYALSQAYNAEGTNVSGNMYAEKDWVRSLFSGGVYGATGEVFASAYRTVTYDTVGRLLTVGLPISNMNMNAQGITNCASLMLTNGANPITMSAGTPNGTQAVLYVVSTNTYVQYMSAGTPPLAVDPTASTVFTGTSNTFTNAVYATGPGYYGNAHNLTNFPASYTPNLLTGTSNTLTLGTANLYSWTLTNTSQITLAPCASNLCASARLDLNRMGYTFTINTTNCITNGLGNVSILTNVGNIVQVLLFDQAYCNTNLLIGGYQLR